MRRSSCGISHSDANESTEDDTIKISDECGRASGNSYCPRECWASAPIIEPTDMPNIAGAIIVERLLSIAIIGSSGDSPGASRLFSAVAKSVNRGRKSLNVRCAHFPRVVVRISVWVSRGPVDNAVISRTCISAMSASALYAIRVLASGSGSEVSPAAPICANCCANSQFNGP